MRVILLLLVFSWFSVSAGSAAPVTLADVLHLSEQHLALAAARLEVARAEALARDAGRRGPDRVGLEVEDVSGRLPGFAESQTTLAFTRPLLDRVRVEAGREEARVGVTAAGLVVTREQWQITSSVQAAFHRALCRRALTDVAREALETARQLADVTQARVEAGATPESETLKAGLEVERARAELVRAEAIAAEAMQALARKVGVASLAGALPVGSLTADVTVPDRGVLAEALLRTHPDLQETALARRTVTAEARRLRADNRPAWAVSVGVRDQRATDDHTFVMALEAELPNRHANAGARRAAALAEERLAVSDAQRRLALTQELDEALAGLARNRATALDVRDRLLPQTERLFGLTLEAYRLGKVQQLVVIEARKNVTDLRRQYLEALDEFYQVLDTVEMLCGVCLVGEEH